MRLRDWVEPVFWSVLSITAVFVIIFVISRPDPPPKPKPKCELPIAIHGHGYVKSGDWGGYYADVVNKNEDKCTYSVKIPGNQNLYHDVYTEVKYDNLVEVK